VRGLAELGNDLLVDRAIPLEELIEGTQQTLETVAIQRQARARCLRLLLGFITFAITLAARGAFLMRASSPK
jgi:hypothetical protein